MIPDYTLVLGVDQKHFQQLKMVIPSWKKYKPSLFEKRWVVFCDDSIGGAEIQHFLLSYGVKDYYIERWPMDGVEHHGDISNKWLNPQRYKMLSGFVHVPAQYVKTPYWLKIDTDVIASGNDDWIEDAWFEDDPAIISQKWAYTKPANQMLELDEWFDNDYNRITNLMGSANILRNYPPLGLAPNEGSSLVSHRRIISWVGFFNTEFTKFCSNAFTQTCGVGQMPCHSQDGSVWYTAKRCGYEIKRVNMKSKNWIQKNSMRNIQEAVNRVMA